MYTTRPDTLFGATYCVLAPEHPLVMQICTEDNKMVINDYVESAKNRSDLERQVASEKENRCLYRSVCHQSSQWKAHPNLGSRLRIDFLWNGCHYGGSSTR